MDYQLVFSPVFKHSLKRLSHFLTRKFSKSLADKVRTEVREQISQRLVSDPLTGPMCDRLIDLGVEGYRQLLIGSHNMVIYRVDEEQQQVLVLLVLDTRQSIQKLLSDVNLML
jgi:addiction module RelE/StbE family toxin